MFGQELQFKVFFVVASLTETVQNFSQWNIFDSTTIRARKTRISTGKRGKKAKSYASQDMLASTRKYMFIRVLKPALIFAFKNFVNGCFRQKLCFETTTKASVFLFTRENPSIIQDVQCINTSSWCYKKERRFDWTIMEVALSHFDTLFISLPDILIRFSPNLFKYIYFLSCRQANNSQN